MKTLYALASAVVLPLLVSCGGAQPPAETPPSSSAAPTAPTAPASTSGTSAAPAAWKDMSHEQRLDYMKNTVLPKMKEEFTGFDSKTFGGMNCGTCHGDGMKDGSFKMPNPKLPKLNPEGGFKKHMTEKPDITKFMMSKVAPDMAQLLSMPHYDPKTGQGFGCGGCHLMEK